MKKLFLMGVILVMALTLSACGKKDVSREQTAPGAPQNQAEEPNKSLMDWLKLGKGVECRLDTPEGEVLMIAKDNKVRIEGQGAMSNDPDAGFGAENGVILATDEWTYFWDKVKKEGTKLSRQFGRENAAQNEEEEELIGDWEEMAKEWEAEKIPYDCRNVVISDAQMLPPADIVFTDLGEIFSGMADSIGDYDTERIEGLDTMSAEELENEMNKILGGQVAE